MYQHFLFFQRNLVLVFVMMDLLRRLLFKGPRVVSQPESSTGDSVVGRGDPDPQQDRDVPPE